jgi:hypothetical protein
MTMTMYDMENQALHQANLVAGMVANTANLWNGLFWATATMGMRVTEQSIRSTGMLLNSSYQVTTWSMPGLTSDTVDTMQADRKTWPVASQAGHTPARRGLTVADAPAPVAVDTAPQPHVRVFEQAAEALSPEADAAFYFRGPDARHNLPVANLQDFVKLARQVDAATWHYHLQRGDYSHWFRTAIQDDTLAAEAMLVEKLDIPAQDSRERILAAVTSRYTIPV